LNVAEDAEYAGVSRDTIYTACERCELRHARIGGRRSIRLRDLLGRCSIIVTERYDRVRLESLKAAVARLDDGQPFKFFQDRPISPLL